MLSYPATIPLSSRTLTHLADRIRRHCRQRRSRWRWRWRRIDPARQALLALAHLRNGDSYTRLAAGFGVGVATAWRYVQEAAALLAAAADDLATAMARIRALVFAILDGLIPIDRVADQRPYHSGKHRRHGVNVQVIADPAGRLAWGIGSAAQRAVHDLTAARTDGTLDALANAGAMTFAGKGYQSAGGTCRHHSNATGTGRGYPAGDGSAVPGSSTTPPRPHRATEQQHRRSVPTPR